MLQCVTISTISASMTALPHAPKVPAVAFHPSKPLFFVTTSNDVKVYNLVKQQLTKRLIVGGASAACLAVHPSGDHMLVGTDDCRVLWFDLDLSAHAYKVLRYHDQPVRAVAWHKRYPLFASASDDALCHVFHGRVYDDMVTNPLVVPLKILKGHAAVDSAGVQDCAFHPY